MKTRSGRSDRMASVVDGVQSRSRSIRCWVVVRHSGREHVMVDALDSGSFDLEGEYRANILGVPYRIGEANLGTAN